MTEWEDIGVTEDALGNVFLPLDAPSENIETAGNDDSRNTPSSATLEDFPSAAIFISDIEHNAQHASFAPNHSSRPLVCRLRWSQKPYSVKDLMAILKA